jgi:hypothetical protein
MNEPVVVNYYSRMRVQRVFPLTVDLQATGALSGRVQVRPIIPGALVTPGIREVELGDGGSTLKFSVTPMAWGPLPHARLGLFQNGRHVGNVAIPMKGVRSLDTWLFLLLALLVPAAILFFTNHLDWSRSGGAKTHEAPLLMSHAVDTPSPKDETTPIPGENQRRAEAMAGAFRTPAKAEDTKPPSTLTEKNSETASKKPPGNVERMIIHEVPEFGGVTKSVAVQMQDCYEVFQKIEKQYYVSLYAGGLFLALALVSWFMNRNIRARTHSNLA